MAGVHQFSKGVNKSEDLLVGQQVEKQEQRDGGGLVDAPLQLFIVSDTKM